MKTESSNVTETKNNFRVASGNCEYMIQRCDFELFPLKNVVVQKQTPYQEIIILDTPKYGRALFLDGDLQSAEADESLYHELLVQPAMLAHPEPKNILIVGTGEGATLREVFKHNSALNVVAIDIDEEVVKLCNQHLPGWHEGKMDDPRVKHVFKDGFEYLKECDEYFDVAIIDIVSDLEDSPAEDLYTPEFYELVKSRLNKNALVGIQGIVLSPVEAESRSHVKLRKTLKQVFKHVHSYKLGIPSFLSSWGFFLVSDWFERSEINPETFDKLIETSHLNAELKHLDGATIQAAFQHDKKIKQFIDR